MGKSKVLFASVFPAGEQKKGLDQSCRVRKAEL